MEHAWIPRDELIFYISSPGYATVQKRFAPGPQERVVTLEAGGWTVSGRVTDRDTKAPITEFRVTEGYAYASGDQDVVWHSGQLVKDSAGRYRTAWDTSGDSRRMLRIEADGHFASEPRRLTVAEKRLTWDVELSRGPDIAGLVRSPDGKPLADAAVALCTATRGLYLRNGRPLESQPSLTVHTRSDGRFSLSPQREPYVLVVLHDQGFAQIENYRSPGEITLRPWARARNTPDREQARRGGGRSYRFRRSLGTWAIGLDPQPASA